MTQTQSPSIRIGCSGMPTGLRRDRYFEKLTFLECPETFANPPRLKVLRSWREGAPGAHFGLLAARVITHSPGKAGFEELPQEQWNDAGGFRDTEVVRAAVARVAEQVSAVGAEIVVFRSATDLSPSTADRLRHFFTEVAPPTALGGALRAWEPGDLWELPSAMRLAEELDLVLVVDPMADNPLGGSAPRPIDVLDRSRPAYLRLRGLGRAHAGFRDFELEELAEALVDFEQAWVVLASADKNRDARTLAAHLERLAE